MQTYFIHDGNTETGPYSIEELRSKKISRDIHVWREGLSSWQPAGTLQELDVLFATIPPPFSEPKPILAAPANHTIRIVKTIGMALVIVVIIVFLFLAGGYAYDYYDGRNRSRVQKSEAFLEKLEKENRKFVKDHITSYVNADRNTYTYSELGGIFGLKITVNNNSNYLIDMVKVKINYIKADGNIWDNKIVEFNYISPNSKITLPIEDTDRGVKITYEIIAIKSSALDL